MNADKENLLPSSGDTHSSDAVEKKSECLQANIQGAVFGSKSGGNLAYMGGGIEAVNQVN